MDYKATLNLPQTDFQMKANLTEREPEMLASWEDSNLYAEILKAGTGRKKYILHDGPPYANGNIHMGHALNKVLKDLVVKSRFMMGFATDYVPGWDCHGLPIELQVERQLGADKAEVSRVEVRRRCREYAEGFVKIQREEFKRLGVFGEWDQPYLTMNYSYQATILRELARFVAGGYVYKGKKPVHWCSSCSTALAEAEVEYADKTSPSVYVRFAIDAGVLHEKLGVSLGDARTSIVIWTTTPWTLPANLAIALHPELDYALIRTDGGKGEALIVAEGLLAELTSKLGLEDPVIIKKFKYADVEGVSARHPFIDRRSPLLPGEHVTLEAGTGCVHIAPGHGQDDYELGLKHGLDIYTPVDAEGKLTSDVPEFEGQFVFKANKGIIALLEERGALMHTEDIRHSYPHCWRCKSPIIFRATAQWFASMEACGNGEEKCGKESTLRGRALDAIENRVKWIPAWGRDRIYNMIANRPDWCLSRQRAWGVPIPALRCNACDNSFLDQALMERLAEAFEADGADVWFERDVAELAGPLALACPECNGTELTKESDILDVWFDSGVSFAAVLEKRDNLESPADLYLEGSDQHRGWFHSSLLTSIGTRGSAPYNSVLTHGFVVDGNGRKMSKSLGNVIAPKEVISKYGAEVLRLWVAAEDYREDIRISEEILKRLSEAYRRIRNTFRYILGNLYDFDPATDMVEYDRLEELDRLTLHRLSHITRRVLTSYETFEFHTIYHTVHNFCTVDLSSFYLDMLKDRLYTNAAGSESRRAAQTAIYHVLDHLVRLLAPVLAFTTEEAWGFMPGRTAGSVHLAGFPEHVSAWTANELDEKWTALLEIRDEVSKALEGARKEKKIGHPLDAEVTVTGGEKTLELLSGEEAAMAGILVVSGFKAGESIDVAPGAFEFESSEIAGLKVIVAKAPGEKCERCWHYSPSVGGSTEHPTVCDRCVEALR